MAGYKAVLFFNQANRGWTETWYRGSGDLPDPKDAALLKIFRTASVFRDPLTDLYAARFSDLTVPRKFRLMKLSGKYQSDIIESPEGPPDVATTDGVFTFSSASTFRKNMFLRGLDDASVKRNAEGVDVPGGLLTKGVEAYKEACKALGWSLRVQSTPFTKVIFFTQVLSMSSNVANPNITDVTIFDNIGGQFADGGMVRFQGNISANLVGMPRIARIIKVFAGPPITFTMNYRLRNASPFVPDKLKVIPLDYQYSVVDSVEFNRFSERKTGRPFGSLRGRAAARAKAV